MPILKKRFVYALALLAASLVSVHAQSIHTLQGKVISPSGSQPANPVMVTLTFSGRPIYETFTDLSGRFSFTALSRGRYQLTAKGDGITFESTSVYAEISAFGNAPQLFTQDIQLRPLLGKPNQRAAVVSAFAQDVPADARQSFEQGLKLADAGDSNKAIEKFQYAVRIFPKYFEAHLQLGNLFLKSGRAGDAIFELDLAREINPNDERSYQSFGLLLMGQRNYPVAVAIFAEAARLNPSNPMNALMRGIALIHQAATVDEANASDRTSLLEKAHQALAQALSLSDNKMKPDGPTLALFYEMKGEPERAAVELEAHLRRAPQAKNAEAIKTEIKRLRDKASTKNKP
jgi:tetratricopeptide (TPR) repeat protein